MNINNRGYLIATLLLGVLMGALDISIVGPAIPPISNSFSLQESDLAWIFSIYVLFNLIFINPFTKLSDKYGRRTAYLLAIVLFGVGSAICAASQSYSMLLVGRAIQGLGSAGVFPVASAIIGDVIEPSKRGRYLGILGSMFGLAFIIGPILAGIMLKSLTWHYLFLINIPISLLLLFAAMFFVPNFKVATSAEHKLDWGGIFLLGGSLGLITFGMSVLNKSTETSITAIIIAVAAIAAWYRLEKNISYASFNVTLLSNRQIKNALTIGFGAGIFQAAFVFFPKFLVSNFNVTVADAGFMLLPLVLGTALGAPISGRMVDKLGSRVVVMMALPMVGLGFITQSAETLSTFYIGSTLIGLGLSMLVGSSLRYIVLNETLKEDRASAQGVLAIAISGGQIIGSALIGITIEKQGNYAIIFTSIAILATLLVLAAARLRSQKSEEAKMSELSSSEK